MTDKQIYPYQIPDSFFLPHKVTSPFYAKVIYKLVEGKPVIEEVGLSPKCLKYINDTAGMITRIEGELIGELRRASRLKNIHPTIASALAPFIRSQQAEHPSAETEDEPVYVRSLRPSLTGKG